MSDKVEQSLYFPEKMLTEMVNEASRQDRSISWCAQKAWQIAGKVISEFSDFGVQASAAQEALAGQLKPYQDSDKRKQTLFFPEEMMIDLKEEASRLDSSISRVVQLAWCIAVPEIRKLEAAKIDDL